MLNLHFKEEASQNKLSFIEAVSLANEYLVNFTA